MKRLLLLPLLLILSTVSTYAEQKSGEWAAGAKISLYTRWDGTFGIGAFGRYGITDNLRIEPSIVAFCREGMSIDVSADLQYAIPVARHAELFPILGVSINDPIRWGVGLNLGGGVNIFSAGNWDFTGSVKWMIESQRYINNPVTASIGTYYRF